MKGDVDKLFDGVRAEVSVPESLRERHLAAICRELNAPPVGAARGVSWFVRHRAALAWLTTGITAMPVAAVASQDALPGEVLYPVKRAVEVVAEPFYPRIQAEHRVAELERLAAEGVEGDVIEEAIEAARAAVAETRADDLIPRIDEIAGAAYVDDDDDDDDTPPATTGVVEGEEGSEVAEPSTTTSMPASEEDSDDDRDGRDDDERDDDGTDDDQNDDRDDSNDHDDDSSEDDDDSDGKKDEKKKKDDSDDGSDDGDSDADDGS